MASKKQPQNNSTDTRDDIEGIKLIGFFNNLTPENSIVTNMDSRFARDDLTAEDLFIYTVMCYCEQRGNGSSLSEVLKESKRTKGFTEDEVKKAYYHLQELGIKPVTKEQAAGAWREQLQAENGGVL